MKRLIPLILVSMLLLLVPARTQAAELITGWVLDPSGRPVAGAQVELYHWKNGLLSFTAVGPDGSYQFPASYGPGLYQVRAVAKGYRLAESGWSFGAGLSAKQLRLSPLFGEVRLRLTDEEGAPLEGTAWLAHPSGALAQTFSVTDGVAVASEILPGSYQLLLHVPGYGIAAQAVQVTAGERSQVAVALTPGGARLSGQVLDSTTGRPVKGTVELLAADGTRITSSTLDDGGRFRLTAPTGSGEVRLRAWAPGYQELVTEPFAATGARDWSAAEALRLQPLFGSVEGVLINRFGRALPRTQVYLVRDGIGEVAAAQTDSNGHFEFAKAPAGSGYRVIADQIIDASAVESLFPPITAPFEVKGGRESRVTLATAAQPTQPVSTGLVTGVIRTPNGEPVADATVTLYRYSKAERTVKSDADGRFSIDHVAGTQQDGWSNPPFSLRVTKAGYLSARAVSLAGQNAYEFHLPGFGVADLAITLNPEQVVAQGRVADSKGTPVAGASIVLQGRTERYTTQSDQSGRYRVTIPQTEVPFASLSVEAAGYQAKSGIAVGVAVTGTGALPSLTLEPLQLVRTGQLLSTTGEGVGGEELTLWTGAAEPIGTVVSDPAGGLRLPLPAGQEGVLVIGPSAALLVPRSGPALTVVNAPAPADLVGWVKNAQGQPVSGVTVTLIEEGAGTVAEVISGPDGSFRFTGVAARGSGWYTLRTGGVSFGAPFLLPAGDLTLQTLWLRK